jgi:hypothetical protein
MPLATVVASVAVGYLPLQRSTFMLIGFLFLVGGPVVVYVFTQDAALTLGYIIVRWVERFLLNALLAAATVTTLGLHARLDPLFGTPLSPPVTHRGVPPGAPAGSPSSQDITVRNAQGIYLQLFGGQVLAVKFPAEVAVHGQLVRVLMSSVSLHCARRNRTGFWLPPRQILLPSLQVQWVLPLNQTHPARCDGRVMLPRETQASGNYASGLHGFRLRPWNTG